MSRPREVFFVGCGRSGTTVVYNTVVSHPDTAWTSRWSDAAVRPELALASPLYRRLFPRASRRVRRFLPYPSEGYRTWDAVLALPEDESLRPLGAADVTVERVRAMDRMIERHLRFGRGSVFVNKNTRNSRRVPFLAASFPDALFVHVVRHPYDVVSSLVRVPWWGGLPLWTEEGRTPASFGDDPVTQARLAARVWHAETTEVLDAVPGLRYVETRYEDFVADPKRVGRELLAAMGLDADDRTLPFASLVRADSVGAGRQRLSAAQLEVVTPLVQATAQRLGYDLD